MINKLFKKKEIWIPNLKGWTIILSFLFALFFLLVLAINPFLSINKPNHGGILIVEGSLTDYDIEQSIGIFKELKCEYILTTGGTVPKGYYHAKYENYAQVGANKLEGFGFPNDKIISLPSKFILKDRTYHNALTVKKWLDTTNIQVTKINIYEIGPHARRSRLLYEKALGTKYQIGIISMNDINYDAKKWWKSSVGFRTVIGESIAYLYVRLFFYP